MLLSRFWYVVLALLFGAAVFVLFLAASMYNRAGARAMKEGLSSDSQVVSWYLKDDARSRAAHLIKFALDPDITRYLNESTKSESKVPEKVREKVEAALKKVNQTIPPEQAFDSVFAVDQYGRVVAHIDYEQASGMENFELGGYPVVADALHGYIRDDTLVLGRLYRVVARPVEHDLGQLPAGAIIGARIIDDRFARELSERTGAAVAFYANGQRVSSGSPEGFDRSQLDQIVGDLADLERDSEYQAKGRSKVRVIGTMLGVQYARLPGEAWAVNAGYAVARLPSSVDGPLGFFSAADDTDKEHANIWVALAFALLAAGIGLVFTIFEHSLPLHRFRREAHLLAKGESEHFQPSRFHGVYRKIASDLNDGVDHLAAKGGVPRRAADFKQVLGDIPDQPQMSAFSFPGDAAQDSAPSQSSPSSTGALPAPEPAAPSAPKRPLPRPQAVQKIGVQREAGDEQGLGTAGSGGEDQEVAEWRDVYQEFVTIKQQCGESVEGFTYEKFEQTLRKNRDNLMARHGANRVRFSVYIKDGKAALKANPLKE